MEYLVAIGFFVLLGWFIPSPWQWLARRSLQKRHDEEIEKLQKKHESEIQKMQSEIQTLRVHLHTKMEIDAEGMTQLKDENKRLTQVIQNLRTTNQTLSSTPGQADLRLLRIYDRGMQIMERKFPVFVPSWRTVLAHVEKEMRQLDEGNAPLVNRTFRPAIQVNELLTDLPNQNTKRLNNQSSDDHTG